MSKYKYIAFVETPLQLLCAYEAIGDRDSYVIILRLTGVGRNDSQTKKLAHELGVNCLMVNAKAGKFESLAISIWRLRGYILKKYNAIYLGSYFSGYFEIIKKFVFGKIYYLDDGVATILAQDKIKNKKKPASVFTFLPITPLIGQQCIRHSFERTRNIFGNDDAEQSGSYFIGQPLIEKELVDIRSYILIIQKASKIAGQKLIYIAHRTESESNLKLISNIEGVEVRKSDLLVEIEMLKSKPHPAEIYSCISTALFSLSILLPKTKIIAIPAASLINNKRTPHVSAVISAMRASNRILVAEF